MFPMTVVEGILYRLSKTKLILKGLPGGRYIFKIIKVALGVVLFPIALTIACVKIIFVWILPRYITQAMRYALNRLLYNDLCKKHLPFNLTLKRQYLFWELNIRGRERIKCYGAKNPDKTFYVIRPYYFTAQNELTKNIAGLCVHYYRVLSLLVYAINNNWIPVVDWENYGGISCKEDFSVLGTHNVWEYFWEQPSNYSLDEVYQSKNVILSVQNVRDQLKYIPSAFFSPPLQHQAEQYAKLCPVYDKNIKFNKFTLSYINKQKDKLFPMNARILGVSIRGTSYGVDKASHNAVILEGHPVQPSLMTLIDSIKIKIKEWNMDYVFLACELESVVETICKYFGDKVIILPRKRYKVGPQRGDFDKGKDALYLPGQRYQTNLDYLTEMALLSSCTSLLAAMSGGVRVAIIWNRNTYENMEIIDGGLM